MMDVQLDTVAMGAAALAGVIISPQHILADVVLAQHLALLVVLSLGDRLPISDGLQELEVKLRCLNNHLADGQDGADPPDGGDMLLDLDLHGRSQPALVLAVDPVVEAGLAVSSLPVPPPPAGTPGG